MLVPDCRNDDYYNEDFLNKEDTLVMHGFDIAIEVVENTISRIDICDLVGELEHSKLIRSIVKTIMRSIASEITNTAEFSRNEMITSMIDDMDGDEYESIRNKVISNNRDKEYYDTREFMCTGKKVRTDDSFSEECTDDGSDESSEKESESTDHGDSNESDSM